MINNDKFIFIKLLNIKLIKSYYIINDKNINIFHYQKNDIRL